MVNIFASPHNVAKPDETASSVAVAPRQRLAPAVRKFRHLARIRMRNAGIISPRRVDRLLFEVWGWD